MEADAQGQRFHFSFAVVGLLVPPAHLHGGSVAPNASGAHGAAAIKMAAVATLNAPNDP